MDQTSQSLSQILNLARRDNPAWQILAARRAPVVIACLQVLFEQYHNGIAMDEAEQALVELLGENQNNPEYELPEANLEQTARKEIRGWLKRKLIIEREGKIFATDALQKVFIFVQGLQNQFMTSTASRLQVVQREVANLESQLNPDPDARAKSLRESIDSLTAELEGIGDEPVSVLEGRAAIEGIRELYSLAMTLRADFRRVEDSYRNADIELRQSIFTDQQDRGQILDRLLDGHDDLLNTAEGQVFHGFQQQLSQKVDLQKMTLGLRKILRHDLVHRALNRQQFSDLKWLVTRLVKESQTVIKARARSEKDVKGYLKTGLASEHQRSLSLINEIREAALAIDWQHQKTRRSLVPLAPVAIALGNLPLLERLRYKELEAEQDLEFVEHQNEAQLEDLEDDFWQNFDTLDQEALLEDSIKLLETQGRPLPVSYFCDQIKTVHTLEAIALWLDIAKFSGQNLANERESFELFDAEERCILRYQVPSVLIDPAAIKQYALAQ